MKACVLAKPSPVESNPLRLMDVPVPGLEAGQVLVRVHACGVCRTDLHVVEGELPPRKSPVIPGHQVVGTIEQNGPGASRFAAGTRVGIPWLHRTCGVCEFCRSGRENLCERAEFTGWTVDGGYAGYVTAPQDFVYALPEGFPDLHVAPLLTRRDHRLSVAATFGSAARRQPGDVWFRSGSARRHPGRAPLEHSRYTPSHATNVTSSSPAISAPSGREARTTSRRRK